MLLHTLHVLPRRACVGVVHSRVPRLTPKPEPGRRDDGSAEAVTASLPLRPKPCNIKRCNPPKAIDHRHLGRGACRDGHIALGLAPATQYPPYPHLNEPPCSTHPPPPTLLLPSTALLQCDCRSPLRHRLVCSRRPWGVLRREGGTMQKVSTGDGAAAAGAPHQTAPPRPRASGGTVRAGRAAGVVCPRGSGASVRLPHGCNAPHQLAATCWSLPATQGLRAAWAWCASASKAATRTLAQRRRSPLWCRPPTLLQSLMTRR